MSWLAIMIYASWAGPSAAATCNKSAAEVYRQVAPSVVRIFSVAIDPFRAQERVELGVGSGVVYDDESRIITNAHIVHGAREIFVTTNDDEMLPAEVVGLDPVSDLAIIRLQDRSRQLSKARFGHSAELVIGQEVLAVGYPFGLGRTATRGIVSAMERVLPITTMSWLTPLVQTDAAINPGNSGGPLLNMCGDVIAINTLTTEQGQNISFSIPVDQVRTLVSQIIEKGRVIRAWHGINGRFVPAPFMYTLGVMPGFLIETIEPGSPAEKLGLRGGSFPVVMGVEEFLLGGDVLMKVNGEKLTDLDTVARIAQSLKVGDTVKLEYWREGQLHEAEVVMPERPILPGDVRRFHERRRPR